MSICPAGWPRIRLSEPIYINLDINLFWPHLLGPGIGHACELASNRLLAFSEFSVWMCVAYSYARLLWPSAKCSIHRIALLGRLQNMLHVEAAPAAVDVDHRPFKTVWNKRTNRIWQRGCDELIHLCNCHCHMEHPTANVDVLLAPKLSKHPQELPQWKCLVSATLVSNVSIPKHHMGDSSLLRGATVQLCILPIIGDCFEVRKMALHSEKNQHALTKVVEFLVFAHFLQAFQGNPKHPETHPQLHHMAASASSRSCCCRRISISAFCTRASRLAARSGFL